MRTVSCLGAGRMARGVAIAFAYAGYRVRIVDIKPRQRGDIELLSVEIDAELHHTLQTLARVGLMEEMAVPAIAERVRVVGAEDAAEGIAGCEIVFECLPEVVDVKLDGLHKASQWADAQTIIASTTSTILSDELADAVVEPERFLNAHWLNPAYLMPLVELSPTTQTSSETVESVKDMLSAIGKVCVVCKARPGYIVPRIQGLAMNEAARIVEEGVASAEDVEKAVKYGFGFRFGVLGLLEFIDWGGGDILYLGSSYLASALGSDRYEPPEIVARNMAEGRIGMKNRQGFLAYEGINLDQHREGRLKDFVRQLRRMDLWLPPAT